MHQYLLLFTMRLHSVICFFAVGHWCSEVWSRWKRTWPCTAESQGYRTTDWFTFRTDNKLILCACIKCCNEPAYLLLTSRQQDVKFKQLLLCLVFFTGLCASSVTQKFIDESLLNFW